MACCAPDVSRRREVKDRQVKRQERSGTDDDVSRREGENSWDQNEVALDRNFEVSCARELALLALMKRTGYDMVQENGQRKYGGPPPNWHGPPPPWDCEVFVGKIPRNMYEDELVPLFEQAGRIYEFRLMMEFSGDNRGYAFVMYTNRVSAHRAIQMLDNYEVRRGRYIGVRVSLNNRRLFIRSIPRNKTKREILDEMKKVTDGVVDVILCPSPSDKNRNRGFAFVEYESHRAAAIARRKLLPGTFLPWGHSIQVSWAKPEKEVDEEMMQRVRVLYVRNLRWETSEETIREEFSHFKPGSVAYVKKLADYAFVHYRTRSDAITALGIMQGASIDGSTVEVTLAKPTSIKEAGSGSARGFGNRGQIAAGGAGDTLFPFQRNGAAHRGSNGYSPQDLPGAAGYANPYYANPYYANPYYEDSCDEESEYDQMVFPLLPCTPLTPTSLLALEQSQITSAVSMLEYRCRKNYWSLPEYHLYSTMSQDGKLLLLYRVVLPSTHSTHIPDRLCLLLDHAKELAAQTALWNITTHWLERPMSNWAGMSCMGGPPSECPSCPTSPPGINHPDDNPASLPFNGQSYTPQMPPPPPPPLSPFLFPYSPNASQAQRLYVSRLSPFY